jgi:hypothetical protein
MVNMPFELRLFIFKIYNNLPLVSPHNHQSVLLSLEMESLGCRILTCFSLEIIV